jgi:hypothetical protein
MSVPQKQDASRSGMQLERRRLGRVLALVLALEEISTLRNRDREDGDHNNSQHGKRHLPA